MTSSSAAPEPTEAPIVSLRGASFGYADRTVLHAVDLDIHPGEVVALLGANGSGKSTLVRGLLGLIDQVHGTVELFGTPIAAFHEHARLGYVPQRHTLSASVRATVSEIVAIGRLTHQSWLARPSRTDREIIAQALDLVGLKDRAREDVSTLSGGQQRRVLIARALAAQPDMLIMDEPTAGVDAASRQVLAEVLSRLTASGATMLIVTHELEALHDIVTRIVVVADGEVQFDGTPKEFAERQRQLAFVHDGHHHDHDGDGRDGNAVATTPGHGPFDSRTGSHRA